MDSCLRAFSGGAGRLTNIIAAEMAMLYYATFGWRLRPEVTRGRPLTFHQSSGWGSIVACLLFLIAAEGLAMHLILGTWSRTAAWIWTGLDLYAALWLLGDYNALRVRRTFIDGDALHLRYGLRWNATIPLALVASIENVARESDWKRRDVLKVAILGEPRLLITLREPIVANGLAGLQKTIRAVALLPDQAGALGDAWRETESRTGSLAG